jgi:phage-related protein
MSSGIKSTDTTVDKFAKILPADVTAAFLSIRAGIEAIGTGPAYTDAIIYSFIAILAVCPFYFRILMDVKSGTQNLFLCLSFVVFGLSIASQNVIDFLPGQYSKAITIIATVAPIMWAFLITPMFLRVFGGWLASQPADETNAEPAAPATGPVPEPIVSINSQAGATP